MSSDPSLMMTAIAGVGSATSQYEAGQSNKAIDRFNAANSRIQAEQAAQVGATEQARVGIKEGILRGAQTSAFAGQGVIAGAGTARAVVAGGEAVSEMDKLMIGINARRQAYGYKVQAAGESFAADQAARLGTERALAGLAETGATIASKYSEKHPATAQKSLLANEGNSGIEYTNNPFAGSTGTLSF